LIALQTVLSVKDLYVLLEVMTVDTYNKRQYQEAWKAKLERERANGS